MPNRIRKIVPKHRPRFLVKRSKHYNFSKNHQHDEHGVDSEMNHTESSISTLKSNSLLTNDLTSNLGDDQQAQNALPSKNKSITESATNLNRTYVSTGILSSATQLATLCTVNCKDEKSGWLWKWTNYLRGYQRRWFVLQAAILSYYRTPDGMDLTCRGTIHLESANIIVQDSYHFTISNGVISIHLRDMNPAEQKSWVAALELAKENALKQRRRHRDSDDESSQTSAYNHEKDSTAIALTESNIDPDRMNDGIEISTVKIALGKKMDDVKMRLEVNNRHYQAFQRALADLEQIDKSEATLAIIKRINQCATLFHVTSTAMTGACQETLEYLQQNVNRWQKIIQYERDARFRMERMCEQVASQNVRLGKQIQRVANRRRPAPSSNFVESHSGTNKFDNDEFSSDDDEFHDALSDPQTVSVFRVPLQHRLSNDDTNMPVIVDENVNSTDEEESDNEQTSREHLPLVIVKKPNKNEQKIENPSNIDVSQNINNPVKSLTINKNRRIRIPERPNQSINLWNIIKNCVGKDLSKIPIPVNFSEPLSMLQRVTEELEYSDVLDRAANIKDSWEQLAYVAAFTISAYSTTATRANKPFNPILGETFECDRTDDLGWRAMSEQVSHHPPAFATHAEGPGWTLYQEFTMSSKFRGQYLSVTPLGYSHLIFKNTGNHFTWKKITTIVNNIIVGKLWIDNVGEMDIINHTTKDICKLKYFPYSYFSRDITHKVTGVITDVDQEPRWALSGTWTEKIEGGPIRSTSSHRSNSTFMEASNMRLLWERKMPPAYMEKMYNFTQLAIQLNEFEDDVAPTDSRRRPDQRLMEEGRWDEANQEKLRVEEKQREARREREIKSGGYDNFKPKWFVKQHDKYTDMNIHVFTNEYWQCKLKHDWSRCDDIF